MLHDTAEPSPREASDSTGATPPKARPRKLSYKEQRELEALPGRIDALEQRQATLEQMVSEPDFYQRAHTEVEKVLAELPIPDPGRRPTEIQAHNPAIVSFLFF